ncbi:hypothetical protein [Cohnella hongkongensis]|uniref:Nitroreductase n=1 Tax=Cohnella hongkongensis TaxID=178337 RepID=A0ABV9FIF7_9BACL
MSVIARLEKICRAPRLQPAAVEAAAVLELLETAVWAPNDGLREPWRFLFVDGERRKSALPRHREGPAHLVVIAKAAGDPHKQEEDLAAVYCLVQNLKLLAGEQGLAVHVHIEDWMYDPGLCQSLGIRANERIAAVLDIGYADVQGEAAKTEEEPPYPRLRVGEF